MDKCRAGGWLVCCSTHDSESLVTACCQLDSQVVLLCNSGAPAGMDTHDTSSGSDWVTRCQVMKCWVNH